MIKLPKTAAREEEKKRCKEKEDIIVVAQDNTGGPRVYKLEKKWQRENKEQKRIGARRNSENSRPAGKRPGSHHKSLQMQMGASERPRKTHFVPVLQATDCTRQERRKTNGRTDGRTDTPGRRTKLNSVRNESLIAIRRLKTGVHILSNDGSYGGELN
jgi:hypothetical protein